MDLLEEKRKANEVEQARRLWLARCATDLKLFATAYFPHLCYRGFNEFHDDLFESCHFLERAIRRARAAPRGYAKSTLEALIEPLHDVCYKVENYIIIFSDTQDNADQKLRDIRTEVLTNASLARDYGIHFRTKKPGETRFVVYCQSHQCLFESRGAGTEVRGVRFGRFRPTKLIVDDGEHSEEVLNEALRKKRFDWFMQVVSNLGTKDTNIKVIGTILHPESLLNGLVKNPAYNGRVYKAVKSWSEREDLWQRWQELYVNLDRDNRKEEAQEFYDENKVELLNGTSVLWEQHESYLDLMKERIEKGNRAFMKEKQNEPIGGEEALFEELHYYTEVEDGFLIERNKLLIPWSEFKNADGSWRSAYATLDPATGQTKAKAGKRGDFSCIPVGMKDSRGRLFVHHDFTKRVAPTKFIAALFELHSIYEFEKAGIETNLYRNLLLPNFMAERKRLELEYRKKMKIAFYDIEQTENKEKRIYSLEPKTTHGWILFNRALSQEFMNQIRAFPFGDNDDAPDALEMLWGLVNGRYRPAALDIDVMGER